LDFQSEPLTGAVVLGDGTSLARKTSSKPTISASHLTQASLAEVLADPKELESNVSGTAPTKFEILMIRDAGGRFPGRRTFIEDLEKLVPEFYDRVGQRLRPWTPPPPSIEKLETGSSATTGKSPSAGAINAEQESTEP